MPNAKLARSIDVLLVESDPKVAEFLSEAIRKSCPSCFLQRVARPQEAEPFFQAEGQTAAPRRLNPSLVLLDLSDPRDPSAGELIQWLRSHQRTKHLPVVVLGTVDDPASVRRAYDLGASSYLVKPADPAGLQQLIGAVAAYWTAFNHPPD